jgi:hypothetical protein
VVLWWIGRFKLGNPGQKLCLAELVPLPERMWLVLAVAEEEFQASLVSDPHLDRV